MAAYDWKSCLFDSSYCLSQKRRGVFVWPSCQKIGEGFWKVSEVAICRYFSNCLFLKFLQYSQESTCVGFYFIKYSDFIKYRLQHRYFLEKHLRVVASKSVTLLIVFDHAEYKNILIVHLSGFRVVMQKEVSRFFRNTGGWELTYQDNQTRN